MSSLCLTPFMFILSTGYWRELTRFIEAALDEERVSNPSAEDISLWAGRVPELFWLWRQSQREGMLAVIKSFGRGLIITPWIILVNALTPGQGRRLCRSWRWDMIYLMRFCFSNWLIPLQTVCEHFKMKFLILVSDVAAPSIASCLWDVRYFRNEQKKHLQHILGSFLRAGFRGMYSAPLPELRSTIKAGESRDLNHVAVLFNMEGAEMCKR